MTISPPPTTIKAKAIPIHTDASNPVLGDASVGWPGVVDVVVDPPWVAVVVPVLEALEEPAGAEV
jgi:hypothetical protein